MIHLSSSSPAGSRRISHGAFNGPCFKFYLSSFSLSFLRYRILGDFPNHLTKKNGAPGCLHAFSPCPMVVFFSFLFFFATFHKIFFLFLLGTCPNPANVLLGYKCLRPRTADAASLRKLENATFGPSTQVFSPWTQLSYVFTVSLFLFVVTATAVEWKGFKLFSSEMLIFPTNKWMMSDQDSTQRGKVMISSWHNPFCKSSAGKVFLRVKVVILTKAFNCVR